MTHNTKAVVSESDKHNIIASIMYETDAFLIINKPYGISVHGENHAKHGVIDYLKIALNNENLQLVHRLDKKTSGILLVAKHRQSLLKLQKLWKDRQVVKRYNTIVYKKWPKKLHLIDKPLSIDYKKSTKTSLCIKQRQTGHY